MSDSVWPHRWQPIRLPRPWDSPSKNTGVGCHFLLQCMKVKSESEVAQSCPTLRDLMDCSPPGSSVHGIFQARVLVSPYMCVCSVAQSCLTLCDPMACKPPGSSVYGIFQTRILEQVAISYFRESSGPRNKLKSLWVSCIGKWILYHWATEEVLSSYIQGIYSKTLSGCLKPRIVSNPMYTIYFHIYMHTYDKV